MVSKTTSPADSNAPVAEKPREEIKSSSPAKEITPSPLPENLPASTLDRPIGRVVIRAGMVDASPIRPKTERNIISGLIGGLLAYLVMVFLWAGSDQRIHSVDDLEGLAVDLNVFGSLPKVKNGQPVSFTRGKAL